MLLFSIAILAVGLWSLIRTINILRFLFKLKTKGQLSKDALYIGIGSFILMLFVSSIVLYVGIMGLMT